MEAPDLKFAELDVESVNEVFKDVARLGHQFSGLLVSQDFFYVLVWPLKVCEEQDEDFLWIARNLNEVDDLTDLMKVSVEHLPVHFDAMLVIADSHGWRSLFRNDVDLVLQMVVPPSSYGHCLIVAVVFGTFAHIFLSLLSKPSARLRVTVILGS